MANPCVDQFVSFLAQSLTPSYPEFISKLNFISLTVILVPLIIFGLLGNKLTLLVVWLRPNMRSSAHLYLSSMAVSDLLILLLLALDLLKMWTGWKLGVIVCKLSTFLSEGCIFCSILHITFLSLERYVVVCWPITAMTLVTRCRTRALIGCLWLGAAVSAAPFLVMMEVDEIKVCIVSQSSFSSGLVLAMIILYYLYVLVPLCILGLVYILIGRTLRLRPQRSSKDKSHQHTVKMLGVIFLAFLLCWLPYIVGLTMSYGSQRTGVESRGTNNDTNTHSDMNTPPESTGNVASVTEPVSLSDWDLKSQKDTQYFILVAGILSRLSAAINPLVYNLMSARHT
ncbi:growth hormone secretagogue receptor type 1-like [Limanda limanda]|uniref:growth hormone secretagogue receptor type 1-like n=1 Tax=Limanda limanda TaxID=27771 RepID=UPI0029C65DB3|nr:growth hormone secretagogue receptor type 1-like [Limanda limanda]